MRAWWGLGLVLLSCDGTITTVVDRCAIDLGEVSPASALPGATVRATGMGPFVDARDTAVFVGGVRATIVSVNGGADDCGECLACKLEADCSVCETECDPSEDLLQDRRRSCFAAATEESTGGFCTRCEPGIEFVIPQGIPAGPTEVWAIGQVGSSNRVPFTVEGVPDTGATSTGSTGDTGAPIP